MRKSVGMGGRYVRMRRFGLLCAVAATVALTGCSRNTFLSEEIDPYAKLTREDFTRLRERTPEPTAVPPPPIPALQPLLANPQPPAPGADRLVSISVTDAVPLKDVLIELSRRADVDIQMDPRIAGGIVFAAREQPFLTVLDRIADLAGLRYSIKDGFIRLELDEPYHQTYRLDVLNLRRATEGTTSISTNVFASVGSGAGASGNNSTSSVVSRSDNDVWAEVNENLRQILANSGRQRPLATPVNLDNAAGGGSGGATDGATPAAAPTPTVLGVPLPLPGVAGAARPAAPAAASTSPAAAAGGQSITQTPPGAPASQAAGAAQLIAASPSQAAPTSTVESFSINRNTGIVSVFATQKQHRAVQSYIDKLRRQASAQVLIEGRIIEVTLNEEYRAGINWRTVFNSEFGAGVNLAPGTSNSSLFSVNPVINPTTGAPFATAAAVPTGVFTASMLDFRGLSAIVQLIESFGTVRALSSPRLTVLNNQTAILKVAQNEVYFTSVVTAGTPATGTIPGTAPSLTSTAQTVPIGLVMSVQPAIDYETNTISLNLRPTISRIVRQVADPSVSFIAQSNVPPVNIVSNIPVVEVQEIDSVLKLRSGSVAIMGGLLRDTGQNEVQGVPGASSIPLLGNLFKARTQTSRVAELVILLRAVIVDTPAPDAADIDLYRRYNRDPRPLVN